MIRKETDNRLAYSWYIKYNTDAYALGPYRYSELKSASEISEEAKIQFGEYPSEIWPDGVVEITDEYEFTLQE